MSRELLPSCSGVYPVLLWTFLSSSWEYWGSPNCSGDYLEDQRDPPGKLYSTLTGNSVDPLAVQGKNPRIWWLSEHMWALCMVWTHPTRRVWLSTMCDKPTFFCCSEQHCFASLRIYVARRPIFLHTGGTASPENLAVCPRDHVCQF